VALELMARYRPRRFLTTPQATVRRQLWADSSKVMAVSGVGVAWSRVDPFIVGVALGPVGAATYGVAAKGYTTLQSITELAVTGLMPATARVGTHMNADAMGRLFRRAVAVSAAAVWLAAAFAIVFRTSIITRWLHDEPSGISGAWVAALALAAVSVPATAASVVIAGANRLFEVLRLQIVLAALNLAIGIALVNVIGVSAVFVGSIVAMVLMTPRELALTAEVTATSRRALLGDLDRVVLLAAGAGLAFVAIRVTGVPDAVALVLAAAVVVGYGVLLATWVIPRDELRRLLGRVSRA